MRNLRSSAYILFLELNRNEREYRVHTFRALSLLTGLVFHLGQSYRVMPKMYSAEQLESETYCAIPSTFPHS